ncbi:MAG: hypothetical protein Q8930_17605, partial [Bacillota bacterium]|nr:hypothetical protein [Bacillota bacterium]
IYVFEYYITGGILKMSKTAFARDILRKDSILRKLLAKERNFQNNPGINKDENGNACIDFSYYKGDALAEDPAELVKELKQRYGGEIGGELHYKGVYITFRQEFYFNERLD